MNDYKLLLVEVRKNDLKLHNMDNVDLFNLLGIFLDGNSTVRETKSRAIQYAIDHKVDKAVIMTAAGAVHRVLGYRMLDEKGEDIMCTFFEKLKDEGVQEGRAAEIVESGMESSLPEEDILAGCKKSWGYLCKKQKNILICLQSRYCKFLSGSALNFAMG